MSGEMKDTGLGEDTAEDTAFRVWMVQQIVRRMRHLACGIWSVPSGRAHTGCSHARGREGAVDFERN